jgi:hypothetical protein
MRNTYRLLVGKPGKKSQQGRPAHRWVDNIKMDLGDVELGGGGLLTGLVWLRIRAGGELL